jgi:RNA polymerase sigma-70 factor, ECF subfamily
MDPDAIAILVRDVLDGQKERFGKLIEAFDKPIYNLALRMTGSTADAADLTQEIFVRAWIHLDRYDPRRPFHTWLYTLAINLIRNHLRRSKKIRTAMDDPGRPRPERAGTPGPAPDPAEALADKQAEHRIRAMLLRLPADQREALLLRFFSDLRYGEMADVLGVSQSAAKMRVSRGLERLRALLDQSAVADSIRD